MKCVQCRFWQSPPKPGGPGECRKAPPLVMVMQSQGLAPGSAKIETIPYFPPAPAGSWCGAFESRTGTAA